MNTLSWSEYFMKLAETTALRSKDPDVKVGAFIANKYNNPLGCGYNGFPANMVETEELWKRPTKYNYVVHAEVNAILNCTTSTKGASIFCTLFPCRDCAKIIAASRISKVYYRNEEVAGKSYVDEVTIDIFKRNEIFFKQLK